VQAVCPRFKGMSFDRLPYSTAEVGKMVVEAMG
jgi:hypothetical protein